MTKYLKFIIGNYYWIYVLLALTLYIGFPDMYSYVILCIVAAMCISMSRNPIKWCAMDTLIVIFIVYQLLSYNFSHYRLSIWYYGVKGQIIPMLFYFFGRNMIFARNEMVKRMRYPMLFAMVVGLVLYFWQPDWYIARRTVRLTAESSEPVFHEVTRLSSFWPWSYAMGFGSLFYLMFYMDDYFATKINYHYLIYLIVALLTLFFAQQRVSIAFFFVFLVFITFFQKKSRSRIKYLWMGIGIFSIGIIYYMFTYADKTFLKYVLNRSVNSDSNIVKERFDMFGNFWKVSLFGDGVGRYGHAVLTYHMKSITDCEYIRLMAELGIMGCCIFAFIYIKSMHRAFRYRSIFMFELSVLLFYLAAMIGATPLENSSMQPFLFWYCIGRIANKRLLKFPPQKWLTNIVNNLARLMVRRELNPCTP